MIKKIRWLNNDLLLGLGILPTDTPRGEKRQLERVAAHQLLAVMVGKPSAEILHNADGAPFIYGWHISISHTRSFIAILLSKRCRVGVDIEYHSNRVQRVASRFLRKDEPAANEEEMLLCWCAKEAVYKLRSSLHLTHEQLRVRLDEGSVDDLMTGDTVPFGREVTPEYVLVWSWEDDDKTLDEK